MWYQVGVNHFKVICPYYGFQRCDNEEFGCEVVVKLDILAMHLKECEHNPKKPVPCALGCGLTVPKDEMVRLQVVAQ